MECCEGRYQSRWRGTHGQSNRRLNTKSGSFSRHTTSRAMLSPQDVGTIFESQWLREGWRARVRSRRYGRGRLTFCKRKGPILPSTCSEAVDLGSGDQRAEDLFSRRWRVRNTKAPTIHERLEKARACLALLDGERSLRGDPVFGKADEQRIVWRELLDLELQDFDEQIERICGAVQNISGCRAPPSAQTKSKPG